MQTVFSGSQCGRMWGYAHEKFYVDSNKIEVVEEYYQGCVINEQLRSQRMVEEGAKAGARVLSERKCTVKMHRYTGGQ